MRRITSRIGIPAIVLTYFMLTTTPAAAPAGDETLVDALANAGRFKTLLAALDAADMTDTLRQREPLTIFAPTDAAFAKLPAGTLDFLTKPANRAQLARLLSYHVVAGRVSSDQFAQAKNKTTLAGADVILASATDGPRVDGVRIIQTDLAAGNGVVHVIDTVLGPKDVVDTARSAGNLTTFLRAAQVAGLIDALKAPEANLTLLAPTDEAFAAMPGPSIEELLQPARRRELDALLKAHILPQRITLSRREARTLDGKPVQMFAAGPFNLAEANVKVADIRATNGVVHIIDRVLRPTPRPAGSPSPVSRRRTPQPIDEARQLTAVTIERGGPLTNAGKHLASATAYENTARLLLVRHGGDLSEGNRQRLRAALIAVRAEQNPRKRAWVLRQALNSVYRSMPRR